MRMYDVIHNKRNGNELSDKEINFFVDGITSGSIPDYQASALMMAIYFRGMNKRETLTLTLAMRDSGDKADLSAFGNLSVDKHSTGGVGDKTTLIVAPIVSSLGCFVAKMSGRGLGHTGGTVDKLESILGYKTALSSSEFISQVKKVGVALVGQTGNFAPADKKLYALRDVTATVESIPLIASSIMSKKLAAGSHSIVLDVKVGSGAFMKTVEDATELANEMVDIGKGAGKSTAAVISNMDIPLGNAIGNALEVKEAVEVLKGQGSEDLKEICLTLSAQMVSLSFNISFNEASEKVKSSLESGKALEQFKKWICAQGGDTSFIEELNNFCPAKYSHDILSKNEGFILKSNAEKIGLASSYLGAGRTKKDDEIDFSAGIVLNKKVGDYVKVGEKLACAYSSVTDDFSIAENEFLSSLEFSKNRVDKPKLIYKIIEK